MAAQQPKRNRSTSFRLVMYIACEIARFHGGSVHVTSSLDVGTAFTVRLPQHYLDTADRPILDQQHV